MAYQLTPDPNVQRTDTSFTAQSIDWQKEISVLGQYMSYARRHGDNDPEKRAKGEQEYKKFVEYSPPKEIVDQKVTERVMKAHQMVVDQATKLYQYYNYDPPAEKVAQLEQNKSSFEAYQNKMIAAANAYDTQKKEAESRTSGDYYDLKEFQRRADMFINQGIPVYDYLVVNPMDPVAHIQGEMKKGVADTFAKDPYEKDGYIHKPSESWYQGWYAETGDEKNPRTPNLENLKGFIAREYKTNAPFQRGIAEDFIKLPESEQKKYGFNDLSWATTSGPNGTPNQKYVEAVKPKLSETTARSPAGKSADKDKIELEHDDKGFYRPKYNKQRISVPLNHWYTVKDGNFESVTKTDPEPDKDQRVIGIGPVEAKDGTKKPMVVIAYSKGQKEFSQSEMDEISAMSKDPVKFMMLQTAGAFKASSGIGLKYVPFEEMQSSLESNYGFKFKGLDEWKKQFESSGGSSTDDEDLNVE
jgi:hypothetical protein